MSDQELSAELFEEESRMNCAESELKTCFIDELQLISGVTLRNVKIAFQTWGSFTGNNAILVCHAISGDSNAAAWWQKIIGSGKAIDTDRFYVVCSNAIGGCSGSTGPSSLNDEGVQHGSSFPSITVEDMVVAQIHLSDFLGINQWLMVCGGSMGGMQAIEWARGYSARVRHCWVTASASAHTAMQIGFNEVARQAILRDENFRGGDYYDFKAPKGGLAVGRMLGHLSYLSESAFESKFARNLQIENGVPDAGPIFLQNKQFQIESYLNYQGENFTARFDANSFLVVSTAIDRYSCDSLEGSRSKFLFTSFTSDWLYPSHLSQKLHEMALSAGCESEWIDIDLPYGHDAFLLDTEFQGKALRKLLSL